jgi:predicted metal-binding membrane protein
VTELLERALRHDRRIVAVSLLLVTVLAWIYLLAGAGMGMSAMEMTRHSMMPIPMMQHAEWDLAYAVLMFFMWWLMMIAMMLPSAAPAILLATALNRRSKEDRPPYGSTASFTAGYLFAWAFFSLGATTVQWWLEGLGWLTPMMASASDLLAGTVLVVAGLWQFSPWKSACLKHCRSPVQLLTEHRRPGNLGAFWMGMHHGWYCLACCWFLMALLFVGGVMNLYWIFGIAIYVAVEKILPGGQRIAKIMGAVLVAWGAWILVRDFLS